MFNIRFKKINNQIENPAQYGEIKKSIARLYTNIKNSNDKKILQGVITSAKSNKTVVVEVTRKFAHPFYGKVLKGQKNIMHMMRITNLKKGEIIKIIECNPISKKKSGKF